MHPIRLSLSSRSSSLSLGLGLSLSLSLGLRLRLRLLLSKVQDLMRSHRLGLPLAILENVLSRLSSLSHETDRHVDLLLPYAFQTVHRLDLGG